MLEKYGLKCNDVFYYLEDLEDYYPGISTDLPQYETIKEKLPSVFISLEVIFTSINWEERDYIFRYLSERKFDGYKEKGSRTMTQLLDKVNNVLIESSTHCWDCRDYAKQLWVLVSITTLKSLK